nr:MAG TPA: hypothetical protein [Inoviridae sp.]DAW98917.1 MAG TPA: hypothetical protein [Inoviridae sp.]
MLERLEIFDFQRFQWFLAREKHLVSPSYAKIWV